MSKIIIAEDDPMISEIYQKKFSESGFETFLATSGEQIFTVLKKEKVDVILLDLMLPKMDGFAVIEKLRKENYDPNIKIVVSSNLSQSENVDRALKLGADGFIIKSNYSPSELVAEVMRLINQFSEQEKNGGKNNKSEKVEKNDEQKGKKILMIEDEEVFSEMFGGKLTQDGFSVTFANNGAWGLKEALKGDYDLFIIDMFLPAMTGEEIVEKLKLEDKTKDKPIIILSASIEDADAERVQKLGISEFMVKTKVIPSELSKKISELLK